MSNENKIVISTDSTALFGNAKKFDTVWGFLKQPDKPIQVEAIGWKWLPLLLPGYKEINVKIKGIHGKTGGIHDAYSLFDRLKLGVLNQLLISNNKLVEMNGTLDYILVHSPQIIKLKERQLIQKLATKINTIFVENHLHVGALGCARENVINLTQHGVNAGLMIDFGHVVNSENDPNDNFHTSQLPFICPLVKVIVYHRN